MTLALLLLQFGLCAVLIARAGYELYVSADRIAATTGLSRGWVGLALLATVTSLPELASGISAVAIVEAPNLAVGNALGAFVFNLLFLVVIDALQRQQPIYHRASAAHLLSAAFGVVMLGFVAMSLVLAEGAPALLHLGLVSPVLLALFLLALRSVFGHEREMKRALKLPDIAPPSASPGRPRHDWLRFGTAALVVLAAGTWLRVLSWVSVGLLATYLLNAALVFLHGGG